MSTTTTTLLASQKSTSNHRSSSSSARNILWWLTLMLLVCPTLSEAQKSNSQAYAIDLEGAVSAFASPVFTIDLGPLSTVRGATPSAYEAQSTLFQIEETSLVAGSSAAAKAVKTAVSGNRSPEASAETLIDHLSVALLGNLSPVPIEADQIASTSLISGECGSLSALGVTQIAGLKLGGILGMEIDLPSNPEPNTVLIDHAGILLVVNEQEISGDGEERLEIITRGLRLTFDDVRVQGVGMVDADLVLAYTEARVDCTGGSEDDETDEDDE